MKKFVLLYHGYVERTPEVLSAWQSWFATIGDSFVDSGNPFASCVEVTSTGSREVSVDEGAATGYSIISAESREEAERLLAGCPIATSIRLYEAMAM